MKVITLNVNGLRSAARKGLYSWLQRQDADVVCLQELKAQEKEIGYRLYHPRRYHGYFHCAERKGYSGVAIYTRTEPREVVSGLGWKDVDADGRYLEARFPGLSIVSVYVHSGSAGPERQAVKFDFLNRFMPFLESLRRKRREYIVCGDWNIAHRKIDIRNWRSNQKHSGFLPEERAWMDRLFGPVGFVDSFRVVNQESDQYTWWSNRGRAWEKNVGWRIDYQVVTPGIGRLVRGASIYKRKRFSDHAPLTIENDYRLE